MKWHTLIIDSHKSGGSNCTVIRLNCICSLIYVLMATLSVIIAGRSIALQKTSGSPLLVLRTCTFQTNTRSRISGNCFPAYGSKIWRTGAPRTTTTSIFLHHLSGALLRHVVLARRPETVRELDHWLLNGYSFPKKKILHCLPSARLRFPLDT